MDIDGMYEAAVAAYRAALPDADDELEARVTALKAVAKQYGVSDPVVEEDEHPCGAHCCGYSGASLYSGKRFLFSL